MNNKSLVLNLYNQTINYLDLTFLDNSLIDLVKTKEDFRKIITNLLTFVIDCEDNELVTEKNQQRLLAAFSAISGKEFEPNTTITFKSDSEMDLEVKSFDTYLIKNLDKNFEQIKSEFKIQHAEEPVKVDSEVIGVTTAANAATKMSDNNENTDTTEHKDFNAEEFFQNNRANINDMAESMINSAAYSMLNMNIRKGTVYKFKSKPKIIPILKWIIIGILCALIALSIASFAVLMVASQPGYFSWKDPRDGQNAQYKTDALQLTTPFPIQLLLTILILVMMIMSMVKNNKNENFKYYMSWGWMLIYIFTLLLTWFIMGGTSGLLFKLGSWKDYFKINENGSEKGLHLINVFRIIQFVIIGLLGLMVIALVIGSAFNPKKDDQRMQQLLEQYANDIKNGTMPFDGGMNDFGRFMGTWF